MKLILCSFDSLLTYSKSLFLLLAVGIEYIHDLANVLIKYILCATTSNFAASQRYVISTKM